jgi:hypothetical protein
MKSHSLVLIFFHCIFSYLNSIFSNFFPKIFFQTVSQHFNWIFHCFFQVSVLFSIYLTLHFIFQVFQSFILSKWSTVKINKVFFAIINSKLFKLNVRHALSQFNLVTLQFDLCNDLHSDFLTFNKNLCIGLIWFWFFSNSFQ